MEKIDVGFLIRWWSDFCERHSDTGWGEVKADNIKDLVAALRQQQAENEEMRAQVERMEQELTQIRAGNASYWTGKPK